MQYEPILVQFSVSSQEEASLIANALLMAKTIACAQISAPVTSIYHWENKLEQTQEWVVSAKSFSIYWQQIEATILEHHSYSVPEILALPIRDISHYYYVWMIKEIIENRQDPL